MGTQEKQFLTDIVQPYLDLDQLLLRPLAVERNISAIHTRVGNLLKSLYHYPEVVNISNYNKNKFQLLCDVVNTIKHTHTRKLKPFAPLHVLPAFVIDERNNFSFLRMIISVPHPKYPTLDFMPVVLGYINFWLERLQIDAVLQVSVNPDNFLPHATLDYNPYYDIEIKSLTGLFFLRDPNGQLLPVENCKASFKIVENISF